MFEHVAERNDIELPMCPVEGVFLNVAQNHTRAMLLRQFRGLRIQLDSYNLAIHFLGEIGGKSAIGTSHFENPASARDKVDELGSRIVRFCGVDLEGVILDDLFKHRLASCETAAQLAFVRRSPSSRAGRWLL